MILVELDKVTKLWGDEAAVRDASFRARPGELLALLGPSGCGKSTILRLIAGLETANSGVIRIGEEVVNNKPAAARAVAMVFQSYALFPHLNVEQNICFGLDVRKVPAAERARRLARASELLGLEKLLARKPKELSGGQQQRVALGRAIVAEQPVCLMDEPLSNLDAKLRAEMRREIRAVQQRLGMTMVYVTHDQVEAMTMADEIVLMNRGRIEQVGQPTDLYQRPATVFAARFIGTPPMNVFPYAVLGGDMAARLDEARPAAAAGRDLAIGVRPEDVRITAEGIPARVAAVEYLGADSLVEMMFAGETLVARLTGEAGIAPGGHVAITWDVRATHWFDVSSGCRVD